jgi:hypothetical protein
MVGFKPTISSGKRPQTTVVMTVNIRPHHDVTLYMHFVAPLKCKTSSRRRYFAGVFTSRRWIFFVCLGGLWAYWTRSEPSPQTVVDILHNIYNRTLKVLVKFSGFTFVYTKVICNIRQAVLPWRSDIPLWHNILRGKWILQNADIRHLTTGICSEKCVVRRFRRCTNVIQCTYTNLDSTV